MTPEPVDTTVAIIAAESTSQADGIRDHTLRLVRELRARPNTHVELLLRRPGAWHADLRSSDTGRPPNGASPDAILLQYNPFWHGRRGFAPGLGLAMLRLRHRLPHARFAVLVHENYIDAENWRWALMGLWQRVQLLALQALFDVQLGTIEGWTRSLKRSWPFTPAHHLPVGSNLPDRRAARAAARSRLGADDGTLVLAAFGMRHPGRLTGHMLGAARAVAADGHEVILVNVGAAAGGEGADDEPFRVVEPGFLDEDEVAELLSAADLFLAAFADGVSTRRTSFMSALQHEVAVVGTSGHLSDRVLLEHTDALELVSVDDPDGFADAARALATDPERRRRLAAAGRRLYEAEFDWPVITRRLLALLEVG